MKWQRTTFAQPIIECQAQRNEGAIELSAPCVHPISSKIFEQFVRMPIKNISEISDMNEVVCKEVTANCPQVAEKIEQNQNRDSESIE